MDLRVAGGPAREGVASMTDPWLMLLAALALWLLEIRLRARGSVQ